MNNQASFGAIQLIWSTAMPFDNKNKTASIPVLLALGGGLWLAMAKAARDGQWPRRMWFALGVAGAVLGFLPVEVTDGDQLNRKRLEATGDDEIATRIAQYELSYRMQTSVPELANLGSESQATLDMYGVTPGEPSYATNALMARRLLEEADKPLPSTADTAIATRLRALHQALAPS